MKGINNFNGVDFIIILLTLIYVGLTAIIWPTLSIGIFVLSVCIIMGLLVTYLSIKYHSKKPLLSGIIAYLIFIEIYFYYFRINLPVPGPFTSNANEVSFGSAFFAFVIVWLTPFFVAICGVDYFANNNKAKIKSK